VTQELAMTAIAQIERLLDRLSPEEELGLIESLARRVRASVRKPDPRDLEVAAMGTDPDILRESAAISEEFAVAEADGLELIP